MRHKLTDWAAAAAFVLVLGASALWGEYERADRVRAKAEDVQKAAKEAERDMKTVEKSPALSRSERDILEEIASSLERGDLEKAAGVMNQEEEQLVTLFYKKMEGRRYLYNGEELTEEIQGEGLVLTKAGAVFFGEFQDGKPQGRCLALQAVKLEAPRYDYSEGLWEDGKMNGEGRTGYCYYEGVPQEEAREVGRQGRFSDDLMEGPITYATINDKNEEALWEMTVEGGVAVMDDRWTYLKDRGEYQLKSVDKENHAYVVGEEQALTPMWANILLWDE